MIILVFDLDDTLLMSNEYRSYETIKFNRELLNLLNSLNYKKIIYTNGTYGHAKNSVPKLLGRDIFNETYARDTIPHMKPLFQSFNHVKNSIFYNLNKHEYDDVSVWIPHRNYNNNIKNQNFPFVDYKYKNIYEALKDMNTIINDLNKPKYIPANNFQGQKKGYHFKKGNNGLGYYLDNKN